MGTKTSEYPDGHAGNGMARLIQKYLPKTEPTLVKLHKEFYNSNMTWLKSGGDPDEWITELERIQVIMEEMGSNMTDKQFIVHVLNNLTPDYDVVVDVNHARIKSTMSPLMIDNLRELLNLHCEKMMDRKTGNKNNRNNRNTTDDTALYAGGKFKGQCRHCGKYGHKNSDCWIRDPSKKPSGGRGNSSNNNNNSNNNNQNGNNRNNANIGNNNNNSSGGRFGGRCQYCHIVGLREKDCWKKKREQGGTGNNNDNNTNMNAPDTAVACIEYEESVALVYMKMDGNEDKEVETIDTKDDGEEHVPEIPDTLFEEVVSEEETEITDYKGEVYTVMVPKIKLCPYACMGCDKYQDRLVEEWRERIITHIPEGRGFGDYGAMKP
jgi:hypothetical protein